MALRGRPDRWELELAIEAALDRHRETGCTIVTAAALVCEMHGIVDEPDRVDVRDVAELRAVLDRASGLAA